MSDNENDRSEYTDKIRRLSANELNAATKNLIEERLLNVNLNVLNNEERRANYLRERTLKSVHDLIREVPISTGTSGDVRQTQSAMHRRKLSTKGKRQTLSSNQNKTKEKPNLLNMLLSSSSVVSLSDKNNNSTNSFENLKPHRDYLNATSMNFFNDITEISDTSDSDEDLKDDSRIMSQGRQFESDSRIKSSRPMSTVKLIRPLTTHELNTNISTPKVMYQAFERKTAPVRRGGFKTTIPDGDEEVNEQSVAAWIKYKNDKKKREKQGLQDAVFTDEKLEKMYYEICAQRTQIPRVSEKKIEEMKRRDPVFAKV